MAKIKRALISVSDKTGIAEFARGLHKLEVEIISTGGTAKLLQESKIPVVEVSEYTGFPEMLNGRVKTLHPKIHAGLLALRNNADHIKQLKKEKIGFIDMVVVNLYPFEKTIAKPGVKLEEAIENIDIGGPTMLRSAAKNYQSVAVVCNPQRYESILEEMKKVLAAPRSDLSKYAPRIESIKISTEKIGDLIGPGGKTIKRLSKNAAAKRLPVLISRKTAQC